MNLILLGAPGAGKGTQAELLTQKLSIPAISTGTMLRDTAMCGMNPGSDVKTYMDGGRLTSGALVLDSAGRKAAQPDCANGFSLDGVLRTPVHAGRAAYADPVVSPTNWDIFEAMGAVV